MMARTMASSIMVRPDWGVEGLLFINVLPALLMPDGILDGCGEFVSFNDQKNIILL
jgi:hypothetical protein